MADILNAIYPWVKSFHVMSVIAWMAGLFYLPRLYVYHVERAKSGSEMDDVFQTMEMKLLTVIMRPAMMSAWLFGLILVATPGTIDWSAVWPWVKAAAVIAMTWFHFWCAKRREEFLTGSNSLTGRQYRMMNEVPTLLMAIIVVSVIARPF